MGAVETGTFETGTFETGTFETDTIAALSTPWGRGGIAVVRVTGSGTVAVLKKIIEECPGKITPRRAYHSFVVNGDKRIDECVMVFFKGPHSYTGEDLAEISIHSNPFLVEEVLGLICGVDGVSARTALPGEFTYRAHKNGKMDLIRAESVNELINANSRYYAHMKFGNLEGGLSRFMDGLKSELIDLGVLIETKIEFEEDQFFDEIGITHRLESPLKRLDGLLANARFNNLLDKGLRVVVTGRVNVGKSSLFNTLLMEERSIISEIPGTTRDFIREKMYIDGFPIELIDVAGINRGTRDRIEARGIERSLEKIDDSHAVIFMLDGSRPLDAGDRDIYRRIKDKKKLLVINKSDIADPAVVGDVHREFPGEDIISVSAVEHINIDGVTGFLRKMVTTAGEKESEFAVNQRQKTALEQLRVVLTGIKDMVEPAVDGERGTMGLPVEIIAEEIRRGIDIIGQLTGEVTAEDILKQIFSEFCVGK